MCRRTCSVVLHTLIAAAALGGGQLRAAQPSQEEMVGPYERNQESIKARVERIEADLQRIEALLVRPKAVDLSTPDGGSVVESRTVERHLDLLTDLALRLRDDLETLQREQSDLTNRLVDVEAKKSRDRLQKTGVRVDKDLPVRPVRPLWGRFVVSNWTGATQTMLVNGVHYHFEPGRNEIMVSYGVVETKLLNSHEALKRWNNWRRNGEHQELRLDINPQACWHDSSWIVVR